MSAAPATLSHAQLLQLKRWNTPTIYNGWEQITRHNAGADCFNLEETRDFMPQMGPMAGYAVTLVIEPSNEKHRRQNPAAWKDYRRYVADAPGPKIVVIQDLDKPRAIGSFWGEVNSNAHRALGCVGTIVDGAIRDLDEMNNAGFKALARRLCVGHAFSQPVRWNCEVEVFGRKVKPGELIHADKHGFLVIPAEDAARLLEAAQFMDSNECSTVIAAARQTQGKTNEEILASLEAASAEFRKAAKRKFQKSGGVVRPPSMKSITRRSFLQTAGLSVAALTVSSTAGSAEKPIQGFEKAVDDPNASKGWEPFSDRKIRVGIVGYGFCKFGAEFGFQNHPNVEVVAVSDLFPDRCAELAKACHCEKTYPSLEELVKDDRIEAVFVATDAPSHARHCIEVLKHGKHVASAVPAVFGSLEDADNLLATVKSTGLKYMMFETSCFHEDLYAMRQIYSAGLFGKLLYSEGEYFHYMAEPLPSYKEWRVGLPPQWYPTHSNAYYAGVTRGSFVEVSCMGMPSRIEHLQPAKNRYQNPFGTEIALFRTSEGGMSRMSVSWDSPGYGGEMGRIRGEKGSFYGKYEGLEKSLPPTRRPPLPPGVAGGGHGGSHGYLMDEFVTSILRDRKPLVDIIMALNLTVAGIVAHRSALKDGELLKIPRYSL